MKDIKKILDETWPNIQYQPRKSEQLSSPPPPVYRPPVIAETPPAKPTAPPTKAPPKPVIPPEPAKKEEMTTCDTCGKEFPASQIASHQKSCQVKMGEPQEDTQSNESDWESAQYAKVVKAYEPQDSVELRLKVGDIVTIIRRTNDKMFKGGLYDKVGLFPIR